MENDDKVIELTDEVTEIADDKVTGKENGSVKLGQEPEDQSPKLSATEKVINELNERIGLAEESGSYFVTITHKEGDKLKHWMGSMRFPKEDRAHSLRELLRMVPMGTKGNVRKFGPRKHGG